MNHELDSIVDKAIEAEKRQALRQFRLSPIPPPRKRASKGFRRLAALGPALPWLGVAGAAVLLLTLGVELMLHSRKPPSEAGVLRRTVEQALLHVHKSQQEPASPGLPSLDSPGHSAEMTWSIQSVFYRLRRLQYSESDLGDAVLRTLSGRDQALRTAEGLDGKVANGLDLRIQQLSSSGAVAQVLARYSRR